MHRFDQTVEKNETWNDVRAAALSDGRDTTPAFLTAFEPAVFMEKIAGAFPLFLCDVL